MKKKLTWTASKSRMSPLFQSDVEQNTADACFVWVVFSVHSVLREPNLKKKMMK